MNLIKGVRSACWAAWRQTLVAIISVVGEIRHTLRNVLEPFYLCVVVKSKAGRQ